MSPSLDPPRDLILLVPTGLQVASALLVLLDQRARRRRGDTVCQGPWAFGVLLIWLFFPLYLWRTHRRHLAVGVIPAFFALAVVGMRAVLTLAGTTVELCPADGDGAQAQGCPAPTDLYHTGDTVVWRLQEARPIPDAVIHAELLPLSGGQPIAQSDEKGPLGHAFSASGTFKLVSPGELELRLSDARGPIAARRFTVIGAPIETTRQ